jgi:hypothetical protein
MELKRFKVEDAQFRSTESLASTMSRKTNAQKELELLELREQQRIQHHVWSRSLERNDADMAAVVDLNRSLHAVKRAFCKDPRGELLLLDLGSGRYRLAPDGRDTLLEVVKQADVESSHEEIEYEELLSLQPIKESDLSMDKQELCVDFLLRQKLRRKLLSRIARRLLRIATSMDIAGDIMAAPPPPKYGDLRLNCDEDTVNEEFAPLRAAKDAAWSRIQAAREAEYLKALEKLRRQEATDGTEDPDDPMETGDDSKPDPSKVASSTVGVTTEEEDPLAGDYAILKDYKDAYEKVIVSSLSKSDTPRSASALQDANQPTSTAVQYPILQQERVEDHVAIESGGGIGSLLKGARMSDKDKEDEFKRWQASILARIPDQPTYAELGLEHRVFFLEERRQRVLRKIKEREKQEKANATNLKEEDSSNDEEDDDEDNAEDEERDDGNDDNGQMKIEENNDIKVDAPMEEGQDDDDDDDEKVKQEDGNVPVKVEVGNNASGAAQSSEDAQLLGDAAEVRGTPVKTENPPIEGADAKLVPSGPEGASTDKVTNKEAYGAVDTMELDHVTDERCQLEGSAVSITKVDDGGETKTDTIVENEDGPKSDERLEKVSSSVEDSEVKDEETTPAAPKNESATNDVDPDTVDESTREAEKATVPSNEDNKKPEYMDPPSPKVVRPIKLVAIPSFYEQDMKRIKLVHADLVSQPLRRNIMATLTIATTEFNEGK